MPTSATVDWERAKRCLLKIDQTSREFLSRAMLIGGAATWFYRQQLVKANDPDFNLQALIFWERVSKKICEFFRMNECNAG